MSAASIQASDNDIGLFGLKKNVFNWQNDTYLSSVEVNKNKSAFACIKRIIQHITVKILGI